MEPGELQVPQRNCVESLVNESE